MSKMIRDGKGRNHAPYAWRMGDVEHSDKVAGQDPWFVRIYYVECKQPEDLNLEATTIFAVVRGRTEQECFNRGHTLLNLCLAGDFDDL